MNREAILSALEWYQDAGVTVTVDVDPNDRFTRELDIPQNNETAPQETNAPVMATSQLQQAHGGITNEIIAKAIAIANECQNLDQLKSAIESFDEHPLKRHASNVVFESGQRNASIMIIGDAPSSDEDRHGEAYSPKGSDGVLLDKILASIDLTRDQDPSKTPVYITHITHWRPPGNRSLNDEELAISRPFIQKQIELAAPQYILCTGGIAGKNILGLKESLSRIRGKFHEYGDNKTPTLVTYSPTFLQSNPLQKRKTWADLLMFKNKVRTNDQ